MRASSGSGIRITKDDDTNDFSAVEVNILNICDASKPDFDLELVSAVLAVGTWEVAPAKVVPPQHSSNEGVSAGFAVRTAQAAASNGVSLNATVYYTFGPDKGTLGVNTIVVPGKGALTQV